MHRCMQAKVVSYSLEDLQIFKGNQLLNEIAKFHRNTAASLSTMSPESPSNDSNKQERKISCALRETVVCHCIQSRLSSEESTSTKWHYLIQARSVDARFRSHAVKPRESSSILQRSTSSKMVVLHLNIYQSVIFEEISATKNPMSIYTSGRLNQVLAILLIIRKDTAAKTIRSKFDKRMHRLSL